MPFYTGKLADGSDAREIEGAYISPDGKEWSNTPYRLGEAHKIKEEIFNHIISRRTLRGEYNLILVKKSKLSYRCRKMVIKMVQKADEELQKTKIMEEDHRQQLIAIGRKDLVDAYDLTVSGWAGVNQKGMIVDRRKHPEAVSVPQTSAMPNIAPPKTLTLSDLDLDCDECMHLLEYLDGDKCNNRCDKCGRDLTDLFELDF